MTNWTSKSSRIFQRVFSGFTTDKPRLWRNDIRHYLISKGFPNLARKFDRYSRGVLPPKQAVLAAIENHVCTCCSDVFLPPGHNVCKRCLRTPRGRKLSHDLKAEASLRNWGVSHPGASYMVKCRKQKTSRANYGTDHPRQNLREAKKHSKTMRTAECVNRRRQTCLERYGVDHQSKDPKVAAKIGRASASVSVQARKIQTSLKNWGTEYPMQNPEVLKSVLKAALKIKRVKCAGKVYECQGAEPVVLKRLVHLFGPRDVVGQFEPNFNPIVLSDKVYIPDAYVASKDTYVEVKSTWTLWGKRGTNDFLSANRAKQQGCNVRGIRLKFIVATKNGRLVQLPKDWCTWSRSTLVSHVTGKGSLLLEARE
jgi:hypothetical protein